MSAETIVKHGLTRRDIADWLLTDQGTDSMTFLCCFADRLERLTGHWPTGTEFREYIESGAVNYPNVFVQRLNSGEPLTSLPFDELSYLDSLVWRMN